MLIQRIHPTVKLPTLATTGAAGFDIYMPEAGTLVKNASEGTKFLLGFAASVPKGYGAFILPRSGAGSKLGVSLNNTVGLIDSDFPGEWFVWLRAKNALPVTWQANQAILQMVIVPVLTPELEPVDILPKISDRPPEGLGSTDKLKK